MSLKVTKITDIVRFKFIVCMSFKYNVEINLHFVQGSNLIFGKCRFNNSYFYFHINTILEPRFDEGTIDLLRNE